MKIKDHLQILLENRKQMTSEVSVVLKMNIKN